MGAPQSSEPALAATQGGSGRVFVATLVGVLLLQLAWILTLPAFGGMDEFDHAFRASAVAHGQVVAGDATKHGRGGQVVVPQDLAKAASAMCSSYDYTGHDNCHPVKDLDHHMVVIDSAASGYNPTYYALAGVFARPFHGAANDIAARIATALMAAALLAWAVVVTRRRTRSPWPFLALMLLITPTLIYSSAITSPNGVGYAAGALVWSSALSFVGARGRPPLIAFTVGSIALVVTHTTNVLWLACIVLAVLLLRSRTEWFSWVRARSKAVAAAAVVVAAATLASVAWLLLLNTAQVGIDDSVVRHYWPTVPAMVGQWAVWCLQTIGAFPIRDQPAPLIVYVMWLLPFVSLMVLGWRAGGRRLRLVMVLVGLAWLLLPTVATVRTYSLIGYAWQGRYAMPLAVGLPILAAHAVALRGHLPRPVTVYGTMALCALGQVICVTAVAAHAYRSTFAPSVVPGDAGVVVAAALSLAGGVLLGWTLTRGNLTRRSLPAGPAPAAAPPRARPAEPVAAG